MMTLYNYFNHFMFSILSVVFFALMAISDLFLGVVSELQRVAEWILDMQEYLLNSGMAVVSLVGSLIQSF